MPSFFVGLLFTGISDYRQIRVATGGYKRKGDEDFGRPGLLNVTKLRELHRQQMGWLREALQAARDRQQPVVVLSHHAPLWTASQMANEDALIGRCPYVIYTDGTPLDELCGQFADVLRLWLFGHTHVVSRQRVHHTLLATNARGYVGQIDDLFSARRFETVKLSA